MKIIKGATPPVCQRCRHRHWVWSGSARSGSARCAQECRDCFLARLPVLEEKVLLSPAFQAVSRLIMQNKCPEAVLALYQAERHWMSNRDARGLVYHWRRKLEEKLREEAARP